MTTLPFPILAALVALVLSAAATDLRNRRIPNSLTVGGVVAGLVLNLGINGMIGARASLLGLALGFVVLLPPFLLRGGGAGDVKLMAAVGALAGPLNTFSIFILTAIFGGVLALALLFWKGGLGRALSNAGFIVGQLAQGRSPHAQRPDLTLEGPGPKLPYAIPIAMGTLTFLAL
ncbi:MAG: prepilin peptidase [Bryobacterales bacterium]|nr:prepilin peptidase [Bryobacterales bacterium]